MVPSSETYSLNEIYSLFSKVVALPVSARIVEPFCTGHLHVQVLGETRVWQGWRGRELRLTLVLVEEHFVHYGQQILISALFLPRKRG